MRPPAVIGSLARDLVGGGAPRVGGGAYHAARGFRLLGRRALVVTKVPEVDRRLLLAPLQALGLPVSWREARAVPSFSFSYRDDERTMRVEAIGDPWLPEEAEGWAGTALAAVEWLQVVPLLRSDVPAETLAVLARGRRVVLDGQGLVRPARVGELVLDAEFDPALLEHVAVLKLAEEEAEALGGTDEAALAALGVPEVVVTLGSRGCLVLAGGRLERVPARPLAGPRVDATGAGDAFAAAYLVARSEGEPPLVAARRATAVAAAIVAGRG